MGVIRTIEFTAFGLWRLQMKDEVPIYIPRDVIVRIVEEKIVAFEPEESSALWFGVVITFSSAQLSCWQVLWENFLKGNLPISQARVLSRWRGESTQVADLFKRHPVWRTIIVGDGKGRLWLRPMFHRLPEYEDAILSPMSSVPR